MNYDKDIAVTPEQVASLMELLEKKDIEKRETISFLLSEDFTPGTMFTVLLNRIIDKKHPVRTRTLTIVGYGEDGVHYKAANGSSCTGTYMQLVNWIDNRRIFK